MKKERMNGIIHSINPLGFIQIWRNKAILWRPDAEIGNFSSGIVRGIEKLFTCRKAPRFMGGQVWAYIWYA